MHRNQQFGDLFKFYKFLGLVFFVKNEESQLKCRNYNYKAYNYIILMSSSKKTLLILCIRQYQFHYFLAFSVKCEHFLTYLPRLHKVNIFQDQLAIISQWPMVISSLHVKQKMIELQINSAQLKSGYRLLLVTLGHEVEQLCIYLKDNLICQRLAPNLL